MATLYFTTTKPARLSMGIVAPPGNYYILGMDGFTSMDEVFKVAISKDHRDKIGSMWLQYNNKKVVCLINECEIYGDELSDFAQTKLTALKWGEREQMFPYGSARYLNGNSKKTLS